MGTLKTLALLKSNFDAARMERKEAEEQIRHGSPYQVGKIEASRTRCLAAVENFNRVESDLDAGLGLVHDQFRATEKATQALTCGTEARGHNEFTYLQEALDIIGELLRRDYQVEQVIMDIEE